MCFSQYAQYAPRPVLEQDYQYQIPARPEGAPPTKADMDENLFGPKPLPPEWQKPTMVNEGHTHTHTHSNGTQADVQVTPQQNSTNSAGLNAGVAAIVVELTNGTKLRISISQE